jgi:hypothetical protein
MRIVQFMAGHSNKQEVVKISSSLPSDNNNNKKQKDCSYLAATAASRIRQKDYLGTEGFTTNKFCELILRDRNRLSKENTMIVCNYTIAMKREINPRLSYIKYTIEFLA